MASAVLTWAASLEPDVVGYTIYRAIGTVPLVPLLSVGTVTTYTDTTLDASKHESLKSATVTKTFTTVPPVTPPPEIPVGRYRAIIEILGPA